MKRNVIKSVGPNITQELTTEVSLNESPIGVTSLADSHVTLDLLLARVDEKNLHDETDTGIRVGKEEW